MVSSPIWAPVCPICNHCPVFLPWTLPFYMVLDGLDSVLPHSLLNFFSQVPSSESPFSPFAVPRNMGSEARGNMSTPSPVHVCSGKTCLLSFCHIFSWLFSARSPLLCHEVSNTEELERRLKGVYSRLVISEHRQACACELDTIMMVDSSHM